MRVTIRVTVFLILFSFLLGMIPVAQAQESPVLHGRPVDIYFNGRPLVWGDAIPFIQDEAPGRTMIPARFFSEMIGADVRWLQDTRQVIVNMPAPSAFDGQFRQVVLQVGTSTALVQIGTDDKYKKEVTLDASVWQEKESPWRTYVPLRFVTECLGGIVGWTPPGESSKIYPNQILEKDEVTTVYFLPEDENDYIIVPGERIGKYRLDWPIEQYTEFFGEPLYTSSPFEHGGYWYIAYNYADKHMYFDVLTSSGEGLVFIGIGPNGNPLIEAETKRYHTSEGLGGNVKVKGQKLTEIYGDPFLVIPRQDNPRYVAWVFRCGISFVLLDDNHIVYIEVFTFPYYPYTYK